MRPLTQLLTPEQLQAADAAWRAGFLDTTPIAYDEATYRPLVELFYEGCGRRAPRQLRFYRSLMGACLALEAEAHALQEEVSRRMAAAGLTDHTALTPSAVARQTEIQQAAAREWQSDARVLPTDDEVAPWVRQWVQPDYVHPRRSSVVAMLHDLVFTNADAAFGAYYDALDATGQTAEIPAAAQLIRPLARVVGGLFLYDDLCVIIDRPSVIHLDAQDQFHAHDGPALAFRDGYTRAFSHGLEIPRECVTPGVREWWLTAERIRDTSNAEERRVFLEIFGADRFIRDLGIQPIDASDYGTLYQVPLEDDEPLTLVRVVNSTEEYDQMETVDRAHWIDAAGARHDLLPGWIAPDGLPTGWSYVPARRRGIGQPHRKEYWLRVPPTMTRARDAVAWTFDLAPDDYVPVQES